MNITLEKVRKDSSLMINDEACAQVCVWVVGLEQVERGA